MSRPTGSALSSPSRLKRKHQLYRLTTLVGELGRTIHVVQNWYEEFKDREQD